MAEPPKAIRGTGHVSVEANLDGGALERLFARIAVSLSSLDCRFDVDAVSGSDAPITVHCGSRDARRFVGRWFHAMKTVQTYETGRNRPITPAPKPTKNSKGAKGRESAPKAGQVICTECLGKDNECRICAGAGTVTVIEAAVWEADQD